MKFHREMEIRKLVAQAVRETLLRFHTQALVHTQWNRRQTKQSCFRKRQALRKSKMPSESGTAACVQQPAPRPAQPTFNWIYSAGGSGSRRCQSAAPSD